MKNFTLFLALFFSRILLLHADNCFWNNGGGDGLWSNPANWSCGHVPGAADDVGIANFSSVNIDVYSISIASLGVFQFSSLDNAPGYDNTSISISGTFTAQNAGISGTGSISVSGNTSILQGVTITHRTLTLDGGGVANSGMDLSYDANLVIPINQTLTCTTEVNTTFGGAFNTGSTLALAGALIKSGPGNLTFSNQYFENAGAITVEEGEVFMGYGGTHTGATFNIAAGTCLAASGGGHGFTDCSFAGIGMGAGIFGTVGSGSIYTFETNTVAATLSFRSFGNNSFTLGQDLNIASWNQTDGLLNGTGNVTLSGNLTHSGGSIENTGDWIVNGNLDWSGGVIQGAGTMMVNGSVNISNDPTLAERTISSTNPFTNEGIFSIESGTFDINGTFSSTGTIKGCNGGGLDLTNASVTNMGDLAPGCSPGILNIIGDYANGGGDLNIEIGGTTVETEYDRLNVSGDANLSGGNINLSLVNSYSPQIGDIFTILDATTLSGAFSTPTDPFVFAGVNWGISYSPGDGTIILEVLSVLPLELLGFELFAEIESNRLDWRSASETKFSHFEIERSADGATWAKIGSVPGLGNTTAEQFYQFTDKQPLPLGYYRLRLVDLDGSAAFSKIVSADRQKQASKLRISPNPFSDQLFINLYAQEAASAFVSLTDVGGKVIWQVQIAVTEGSNQLHFDLPEIPQGIYMLQMKMPGLQIAERVARM